MRRTGRAGACSCGWGSRAGRGADALVFTTREHKPLNRNYINACIWKPALRKAGLEPTRFNGMHALRHYYASALLESGEHPGGL